MVHISYKVVVLSQIWLKMGKLGVKLFCKTVFIRQLLSIFDQLGKLQPKMIVYQGPIYMKQPTLSDQTLLCREPTKIGHIFLWRFDPILTLKNDLTRADFGKFSGVLHNIGWSDKGGCSSGIAHWYPIFFSLQGPKRQQS